MALIRGIPVVIFERTQIGTDGFNAPVYEEVPVTVENVLVSPVSSEAISESFQLYGKRAVYELCIPKGDSHDWQDRFVVFFGQKWRTFGFVTEYIRENVPLDWNGKVKVERYG